MSAEHPPCQVTIQTALKLAMQQQQHLPQLVQEEISRLHHHKAHKALEPHFQAEQHGACCRKMETPSQPIANLAWAGPGAAAGEDKPASQGGLVMLFV